MTSINIIHGRGQIFAQKLLFARNQAHIGTEFLKLCGGCTKKSSTNKSAYIHHPVSASYLNKKTNFPTQVGESSEKVRCFNKNEEVFTISKAGDHELTGLFIYFEIYNSVNSGTV